MIWSLISIISLLGLVWSIHWSAGMVGPAERSSRWHRNRRATVSTGLFVIAGSVLIIALVNGCRYPCQQWQSTGLDVLAMLASFLMGTMLTRILDSDTKPFYYVVRVAIWFGILLLVTTALIFSPLNVSTPHSIALFIWALALPVLGWCGKQLWPWLF